jgi:hypothetical protein
MADPARRGNRADDVTRTLLIAGAPCSDRLQIPIDPHPFVGGGPMDPRRKLIVWMSFAAALGLCVLPRSTWAQPEPEGGSPAPPPPPRAAPAPSDIDRQLVELSNPDPARRHSAAVQLGQLGDRRAIPALVQALQTDSSEAVRAAAAFSLGTLGAREAAPNLSAAADHDPAPEVRTAAATALQQVGGAPPPGVVPPPLPGTSALESDPAYVSGRRMRTAGIIVTSVGGGIGFTLMAVFLISYSSCDSSPYSYPYYGYTSSSDCAARKNAAIGFGVLGGVSVAVGLPLIIAGIIKAKNAEARLAGRAAFLPRLNLALGREWNGMTATWAF